jgi:hypothetical protein
VQPMRVTSLQIAEQEDNIYNDHCPKIDHSAIL